MSAPGATDAYRSGYREGHDDGYMQRDQRFMFHEYDFATGYRAGFDAGRAQRRYERTHQRPQACPIPDERGNLSGNLWCGECLIYTNHSGEQHRAAEAEGRQEL